MTAGKVPDTPRSYFEDRYRSSDDPWGFDTRWYEQRKYELTMALLPRPSYDRATEPGCSNGALTTRLADRCAEVIAFDLLPDVAARAARRTADQPGVSVACRDLSTWWPDGDGDLVVFSEVLYYLAGPNLADVLDRALAWLRPGGHLVSVHYCGATNYPQTAEQVHATIDDHDRLERISLLREPEFLAGVWSVDELEQHHQVHGGYR